MKYKAIFFDLDHTLWDYETNSRETLTEMYEHHGLANKGVPDAASFANVFRQVNDQLWYQFDRGLITSETIRRERFITVLRAFGIDDTELASELSDDYIHACPRRCNLMPYALDTLQYLSGRYSLTVITNGFDEIQKMKLESGNLASFFNHVVTSQKAGHRKPAKEIFEYALRSNAVQPQEALMVGDNLITDIGGACNASIDTAFFNPERMLHDTPVNYEIASLKELCDLL
ncbi:MAG TPA: YjjG family noncanonical pyrimidine nucleotidase [Cyclobacteriaceae bacterium]|jgi:putative hydrolase of the HAD superfamily|nr:MAG: noncanonical pyrimidine nucleotidase, YjjG family [Bacteroidota bacterium]